MSRKALENERRQWPRLPLAIPIFVRSRDEKNKDLLEFATALNVSAGGVLVATRRSLPLSRPVSLEIPSAPIPGMPFSNHGSRLLEARPVRVVHGEGHHLIGMEFFEPLVEKPRKPTSKLRKLRSPV